MQEGPEGSHLKTRTLWSAQVEGHGCVVGGVEGFGLVHAEGRKRSNQKNFKYQSKEQKLVKPHPWLRRYFWYCGQ